MKKKEKDLSNVVLLCPKNDVESTLILEIAKKIGLEIIESNQHHGAVLKNEKDLLEKLAKLNKREIWIVEIPGPREEKVLRGKGYKVRVIDHHWYQLPERKLDRTKKQNRYLPSSLEQFLKFVNLKDSDLKKFGFDPIVVKGTGYLDAGFIKVLIKHGYSKTDIKKVLKFQDKILKEIFPSYIAGRKLAKKAWQKKEKIGKYYLVRSKYKRNLRAQVIDVAALDGIYNQPLIVEDYNGGKLYVQNFDPRIIRKLQNKIKGHTFTFGTNKCWGIDNFKTRKMGHPMISLQEICEILKIPCQK